MRVYSRAIVAFLLFLCVSLSVFAVTDFTPAANINMRSRNITNVTLLEFSDGTSMTTALSGSSSSYNDTNLTTRVSNLETANVTTRAMLSQINTSANILTHAYAAGINKTTELFTYFSGLFLGVGDQRFNETTRINDINTTLQTKINSSQDQNNYTIACSVSGTTTKSVTCSRNGATNVSFSWTDADTDTNSGGTSNVTNIITGSQYIVVSGNATHFNITLNATAVNGSWNDSALIASINLSIDTVWKANASSQAILINALQVAVANLQTANTTTNSSVTTLIGRLNALNITCTGGNSTHFNVTNGTGCVMVAQNPGGGSGVAGDSSYGGGWTNATSGEVRLTNNATNVSVGNKQFEDPWDGGNEYNSSLFFVDNTNGLITAFLNETPDLSDYSAGAAQLMYVYGTTYSTLLKSRGLYLDGSYFDEEKLSVNNSVDINPNSVAGLGSLIIRSDGLPRFFVDGGDGDIDINVDTNYDSAHSLTVGGSVNVTGDIYSNGYLVCQSDGTNCPSSSGGNASWNETRGNAIYYLRTDGTLDNRSWNETRADAKYALIGSGGGNMSMFRLSVDGQSASSVQNNSLVHLISGIGISITNDTKGNITIANTGVIAEVDPDFHMYVDTGLFSEGKMCGISGGIIDCGIVGYSSASAAADLQNTTIARNGTKGCTGTDKLTNLTINSSGVFGACGTETTGSGSTGVTGNGTTDYLPRFSNATNVSNSIMYQSSTATDKVIDGGNYIRINGSLIVDGVIQENSGVEVLSMTTYLCPFTVASATTMCYPNYLGSALSSGTAPSGTGTALHPGSIVVTSTASASTGYQFSTSATAFLLNGSEEFRFSANVSEVGGTQTNSSRTRIGFIDVITTGAQADGVYFEIWTNSTGTFVAGVTANNSAYNSTANFSLTNNLWYNYEFKISPDASNVTFRVYNDNAALLWNATLVRTAQRGVPIVAGRETGAGFVSYRTTAGTARAIMTIDYMVAEIAARRRVFG